MRPAWWRRLVCWAWGHNAPPEVRGRVRAMGRSREGVRYLMTHRWTCTTCHRQVGGL